MYIVEVILKLARTVVYLFNTSKNDINHSINKFLIVFKYLLGFDTLTYTQQQN